MGKRIKAIKKNIKRYKKSRFARAKYTYTKYYDKLEIEKDTVLIQSYDGTSISGNPYYILSELCKRKEYEHLKKYVVTTENVRDEMQELIEEKGIKEVKIVTLHSKKYCRILATANFLINNSTFPTYFIKKEGQIYLNTWHGTPLKQLGRKIIDAPNEIGNTQRNFLMSDYLLYPNEFTYKNMREDYMLTNYYKGEYLITGYPRNDAFFDKSSEEKIREEMDLIGKKVAVYMPTWRGNLAKKEDDKQFIYIMHMLYELEEKLEDNTIVFIKLHAQTKSKLKLNKFNKIRFFPNNYETYEFLNIADVLITDYSSVFFDYANTKRKIILYGYDKDEYIKNKGMYLDYNELPFCFVNNTDELIREIKDVTHYKDYSEFNDIYNKYDKENSAKDLCDYVFNGKKNDNIKVIKGEDLSNGKQNILIFTGTLAKNGITTALRALLANVDKNEYNYVLNFYKKAVENNKSIINTFKQVDYMPIQGEKDMTISEAIIHFLYFRMNLNSSYIKKRLAKIYKREVQRVFPGMNFKCVINYSGYEKQIMNLYTQIDAEKIIYTHNDMGKEIKTKNNTHKNSLKSAYDNCDKIVIIRESMKKGMYDYAKGIDENKIVVAHNFNNVQDIKQKSKLDVAFDEDTFCNYELEDLKAILEDKSAIKFINIARYSAEKGLDRLIGAFTTYNQENEKSYLIIIGGYGKEFNNIKNMIEERDLKNIIIIKSLSNPYAILNKCNAFVLSSRYEGLPMVIMEALILDKPVISTNITGPREFLSQGYGYLVDDSTEGILKGMRDFSDGKIKNLKKFDAEEFNENALKEFNSLIGTKEKEMANKI